MQERITLLDINAIPSSIIALASSVMTSADQVTGQPSKMVIDIAIDQSRADSIGVEMPVFMPADFNYQSSEHYQLLDALRAGEIFVPVIFYGLKIFRTLIDGKYNYYATANSFTVTSKEYIDF